MSNKTQQDFELHFCQLEISSVAVARRQDMYLSPSNGGNKCED